MREKVHFPLISKPWCAVELCHATFVILDHSLHGVEVIRGSSLRASGGVIVGDRIVMLDIRWLQRTAPLTGLAPQRRPWLIHPLKHVGDIRFSRH